MLFLSEKNNKETNYVYYTVIDLVFL